MTKTAKTIIGSIPTALLVGGVLWTYKMGNTAADNEKDIQSLTQAQRADHDVITAQTEQIKNIDNKVSELDKDFGEYRKEQRYVNRKILEQLYNLGSGPVYTERTER